MVTRRKIFAGMALGLCLAAATAAASREPGPSSAAGHDGQSAEQLMQNCDAHKFETVITATVNGQPHQSKVKLCGKEGQSDADWIGTLRDAVAKLNADNSMAPSVRGQIVAAINAEIARLQIGQVVTPAQAATALPPPRPRPQVSEPLGDEFSSLPPLPATPPPPPHVIGPGALAISSGTAGKSTIVLPRATGPAPKLSFACYSTGDIGGDAPCTQFERDTMLTISAGENVGAGVLLRFARNGEEKAQIGLPELRRGRSVRVSLPSEVCAGVSDGRLDLELVRNGELLQSDGPYSLRC